MIALLGMIVVFCSVIGGYALESGRFGLPVQLVEGMMICGSALGFLIASNSPELLKLTFERLHSVFRATRLTREYYVASLVLLRALFEYARRNGATKLEYHLDHPERSAVFNRHRVVFGDEVALHLICDTLRLKTDLQSDHSGLEQLLENETEIFESELSRPAEAMAALADALPGLGILAAVLGLVITMGSITASPKVIGQQVGGALAGTFLGIFLSYGFVGPLAAHLTGLHEAEATYYRVLRRSLGAFSRGMPASVALEFGRRSIPPELRPAFSEMEKHFVRAGGSGQKVVAVG